MSNSKIQVKPLSEQCIEHIVMHLEEYPPSYLALLPLWLRKKILWRLPMADACRLEDTQFVTGISMEDYWGSVYSLPVRDQGCIMTYFENQRKSGLPKAIVIGMLVSICLGVFRLGNSHFLVHYDDDLTASILVTFGVRDEESMGQVVESGIVIPPRYQQYTLCSSKEELLSIIMTDFFPNQLSYLHMEDVDEVDCGRLLSCIPLFRNLRYLAVENHDFGSTTQNLIVTIAREAPKLEVLCLQYEPEDENATQLQSLDQTISELASSDFVSSMHLLVLAAISQFDSDVDGFFSVSHGCLKRFIDALTADHQQIIRLEGVTILCKTIQELQELLSLNNSNKKVIEIYMCKFCVENGTL
jgi:hypothetical protein